MEHSGICFLSFDDLALWMEMVLGAFFLVKLRCGLRGGTSCWLRGIVAWSFLELFLAVMWKPTRGLMIADLYNSPRYGQGEVAAAGESASR